MESRFSGKAHVYGDDLLLSRVSSNVESALFRYDLSTGEVTPVAGEAEAARPA